MVFRYCKERCLSCETDSILTCGKGVDGVTRAIRTDVNNILATLPSAGTHSQIGRLFSIVDNGTVNANFPSGYIIITNPSDSGRIMYLDSVIGGGRLTPTGQELNYKGALGIEIADVPVFEITEDLSIHNLNFGFPSNSAMMAGFNLTRPGGSVVFNMIQIVNPFRLNFEGKIIVPPGNTIAIGVKNYGLSLADPDSVFYEITVIWYELDIPAD